MNLKLVEKGNNDNIFGMFVYCYFPLFVNTIDDIMIYVNFDSDLIVVP